MKIKIAQALFELNGFKLITHSLFQSEKEAKETAEKLGLKFICWPFPVNSEREIED